MIQVYPPETFEGSKTAFGDVLKFQPEVARFPLPWVFQKKAKNSVSTSVGGDEVGDYEGCVSLITTPPYPPPKEKLWK